MLWLLSSIYFLPKPDCRTKQIYLQEHCNCNTIINQRLCGEEWYQVLFLLCCHLCCFCFKLTLFTDYSFSLYLILWYKWFCPKSHKNVPPYCNWKFITCMWYEKIWLSSSFYLSECKIFGSWNFSDFFFMKLYNNKKNDTSYNKKNDGSWFLKKRSAESAQKVPKMT